jgi:hypothetical protein
VRASPVDEEHASLSGPPAGVAVIWLIFYGLIFAGWLGSGEARHVSNAYPHADAAASRAATALSARTSRPD